jgi:formylglycine-generating enzyme required for sulfatase activity
MVLIEGGNMFMGSTDADLDDDVRPPHKVTVGAYCLDEHEVTVAAYEKCSGSGDCLRASSEVVFEGLSPDQIKIFSALCNEGKSDKQDHPINCVDWSMADHFCRGEKGRLPEGGARLPTEAEWEFAARGSSQRVFPWGDEPPGPARLNACGSECAKWLADVGIAGAQTMYESDDGFAGTSPVGHFEAGVSAAGIFDLAGNVWEWTADFYGPYSAAAVTDPKGPDSGDTRVVRGGAFNGAEPGWAKPAWRWRTAPTSKSHGIGFRCAANQR